MPKFRAFIFYWLPVIVWMCAIFTASSDAGSFKHSSRIIEPLMHWLFPHASDHTVYLVLISFRKCAHLTEYAILAILVWRARRKPFRGDRRPWRWSEAAEGLWVNVFYAATDEFHQTFIPTREGCIRDVMIDSTGAVVGLLLLWQLGRWRKWW